MDQEVQKSDIMFVLGLGQAIFGCEDVLKHETLVEK